jgi:uncharacterized membrane protein
MYKKICIIAFSLMILAGGWTASAATANDNIRSQDSKFMELAGFAVDTTVGGIAGLLIKTVLSFLAIIFVVLLVYSGFQWMTAQGNEDKVTKAKETIVRAVIGLVIIIAAYSITAFVFSRLNEAGGGSGPGIETSSSG